tara:strand:+ start:2161 stop:2418 length:258 start_codon:yes stop_codon:yes gene_type:complete
MDRNDISTEFLDSILENYNNWVLDPREGSRADLSNTNLQSVDFSKANLKDAIMRNVDLSFSILEYAKLTNVDLEGSPVCQPEPIH